MRRLIVALAGALLLSTLGPVTGGGQDTVEAPEFPFAVEGLPDGSHLWVGKGSVGRSMGTDILWATPVPGGPPGPVNDPVLEARDGQVFVLNAAGIHVFDLETGAPIEQRGLSTDETHLQGGFTVQTPDGIASVVHGLGFVEAQGPGTAGVLWTPPVFTRAVPMDHDGDGDELIAALSSDDWPNDEWWIRALEPDGTERWSTTVTAFARGFPCLTSAQLDEDPADELLLAVGGTTAAAVDDDGTVLWTVEGAGIRNTVHCTSGDVTGDGIADLVVATFDPFDRQAGTIAVHEGPDGSIRWRVAEHKGASYLALTDADGDGIDDVIGATYGFSNPGFPQTKPSWPGGARSNHVVALDGEAELAPVVLWRQTFAPNRGYVSSGAADLEVLEHPDGDRLGLPLRDAGGLLLLDPETGATLDNLAGAHRAQAAAFLDGTGFVGGQDGTIWRAAESGELAWARVPGSILDLDGGAAGLAVGYGQGVRVLDDSGAASWDRRLPGPAVHASWLAGNLLVGEQDADLEPPLVSNLHLFAPDGQPIASQPIAGGIWGLAPVEDRTGDGVPELVISAVGQGRFAQGGNQLVDGASLLPLGDLPGPQAHTIVPTPDGVLLLAQRSVAMLDLDTNEIRWTRSAYPSDAVGLADGSLLLADWVEATLVQLDPATGDVLESNELDDKPGRLIDAGSKIVVEVRGDDAAAWTYEDGTIAGPFDGQSPIACQAGTCVGQPGPNLAQPVP